MTKWETLIACRNHWQVVEITGYKEAYVYPGRKPRNDCYCCEYSFGRKGYDYMFVPLVLDNGHQSSEGTQCQDCPLMGFAWPHENFACEASEESVYFCWVGGMKDEEDAKRLATGMVKACNRAIEAYILNDETE